eukprot:2789569-Rhodomonas_salina.2
MDATSASFPTPPRMNLMVGRALTLKREARRSHESTLARRNLALATHVGYRVMPYDATVDFPCQTTQTGG